MPSSRITKTTKPTMPALRSSPRVAALQKAQGNQTYGYPSPSAQGPSSKAMTDDVEQEEPQDSADGGLGSSKPKKAPPKKAPPKKKAPNRVQKKNSNHSSSSSSRRAKRQLPSPPKPRRKTPAFDESPDFPMFAKPSEQVAGQRPVPSFAQSSNQGLGASLQANYEGNFPPKSNIDESSKGEKYQPSERQKEHDRIRKKLEAENRNTPCGHGLGLQNNRFTGRPQLWWRDWNGNFRPKLQIDG